MDIGWNFRREHLRLSQRSHYVIPDGGDQPNVVPRTASVWYYFRETDYRAHQVALGNGRHDGEGGGDDGGHRSQPTQVLGSAWPQHFNKVVAETTWANIQTVGLPEWSDADQTARQGAAEGAEESEEQGLRTKLKETLQGPVDGKHGRRLRRHRRHLLERPDGHAPLSRRTFPDLPGHNWANAIAMATPIAHKGVIAGAKVQAMTLLDLMRSPSSWSRRGSISGTCRRRTPSTSRSSGRRTSRRSG